MTSRARHLLLFFTVLALSALACVRSQPEVIVITATYVGSEGFPTLAAQQASPTPPATLPPATAAGTSIAANQPQREYVVRAGDSLSAIAAANGVSLQTLQQLNNLTNPDNIFVGQVLRLPEPPSVQASDFRIVPDSRMVLGPGSSRFDVAAFVRQQPGYIRVASDLVDGTLLSAADVVQRVAYEYSVDPRLLLALLEYRSRWLSDSNPSEEARDYALGGPASPFGFDRSGLYRQMAWAADNLNRGYYGWKLRALRSMEFSEGARYLYAASLNPGTVAVQYLFSLTSDYATWSRQVSRDGLYQTYVQYFGDPFADAVEPLVPANLVQPAMTLPYADGEIWYYTGGPHGGWGTGSAWAAVDFAPPDEVQPGMSSCYVSEFYVRAVAPGVIARTDEGVVVLDLDGDGDETTGWSVLYLHIASEDRIEAGTVVEQGDPIGHASCEGGVSNGTHVHIARRYNGEWIPASCETCPQELALPPFVMGGWETVGLPNQEYQGYLKRGSESKVAEAGRLIADNEVGW